MEENEWETIQPPQFTPSPSGQSEEEDGDGDVVVVKPTLDESSVFPPSNHEGLPVITPSSSSSQINQLHEPNPVNSPLSSSYSSSSTSSLSEMVEAEAPRQPEEKTPLAILSSGIFQVAYGIRKRIGFWSIASVASLIVVAVYGRMWQRLRRRVDQLMLLVKEKDEKIKQLLLQIDRMNELISTRRRVPVLRVVVDSPPVTSARVNWKPA